MVTINEMSENTIAYLKSKSTYLEIDSDRIQEGLVGEKEEEVFNVTNSFIRLYVAEQPAMVDYYDSFIPTRLGSMMVLCGIADTDMLTASKNSHLLAQRIERALLEANIGLWRETEPIFNIKNSEGISIFGVPLFFEYKSAAGDPNG